MVEHRIIPGRRDKSKVWVEHIHPIIYKIDNHKGPTGNSTQYSVITYLKKESKKEWRYIYV